MVKAALGKGMKDLLAKNFGMEDKEEGPKNKAEALDELKVNISRYRAQGFNVDDLKDLKEKNANSIIKGIESYRKGVKVLNTAQTILKSLEGYGYSKEIEIINEKIIFPSRANEVLSEVEELKERAKAEHDIEEKSRSVNASKLSESLKKKSQKLNNGSDHDEEEELDEGALDELLGDLDEIGDTFSLEIEDDPVLSKISEWEEMGYFVDGLKNTVGEDREKANIEIDQFEKDVARMEPLKKRYREMDLTGLQDEVKDLDLKFQYPHLAKEVENELDRIDSIRKKADDIHENEKQSIQDDEVVADVEIEVRSETKEAKTVGEYADKTADELVEMAKIAYKNGNLELSLTLFKELLKKDPESSKARFMIRRLSSKL